MRTIMIGQRRLFNNMHDGLGHHRQIRRNSRRCTARLTKLAVCLFRMVRLIARCGLRAAIVRGNHRSIGTGLRRPSARSRAEGE